MPTAQCIDQELIQYTRTGRESVCQALPPYFCVYNAERGGVNVVTKSYELRPMDVDVSRNFLSWFLIGFVNSCIIVIGGFIGTIGAAANKNGLYWIGMGVALFAQFFAWGAWFAYGCYLRFGLAGDKCSGHDLRPAKSE